MKSSILVLVAALFLMGCPPVNEGSTAPVYRGIVQTGETIEVSFDRALGEVDATNITVNRGGLPLAVATYTLSIRDSRLVITLSPFAAGDYTVELRAGAVRGRDGQASRAKSGPAAITLKATPPVYKAIARGDGDAIEITFDKALKEAVAANITVNRASVALTVGADYTLSVNDVKLIITPTSFVEGDYSVELRAGAVTSRDNKPSKAKADGLAKITLNIAPTYEEIAQAGDVIELSFDRTLKAFDAASITVNRAGLPLAVDADYTLSIDGMKLVVTPTPFVEGDYSVELQAGAVTSRDNNERSKTRADAAAITLHKAPEFSGIARVGHTIEMTFDKALKEAVAANITVNRASVALTVGADYTLSVNDVKLVVTPTPFVVGNYTVALRAGAVTSKDDAGGRPSKAKSGPAAIALNAAPVYQGMELFPLPLDKRLELSFDKALAGFRGGGITVSRNNTVLTEGGTNDYVLSVDGVKLVVKFTATPIVGQKYTVAWEAEAIEATDGGLSQAKTDGLANITLQKTPEYQGHELLVEFAYAKNSEGRAQEGDEPKNKIEITFDRILKSFDSEKIAVEWTLPQPLVRGRPDGYSLEIDGTKLVVHLNAVVSEFFSNLVTTTFSVTLEAGAVTSKGDNQLSEAKTGEPTASTLSEPPKMQGAPLFEANSDTSLVVTFDKALGRADKSRIKIQSRVAGGNYGTDVTAAEAEIDQTDGKKLKITLGTGATVGRVYRVAVGTGGVATTGKIANGKAITSGEVLYSTAPALDSNTVPYILNNKLIATFDITIAMVNAGGVKVYKNPTGTGDTALGGTTVTVNRAEKTRLEIDLPAVAENDVYRLALDAGAVRAVSADGIRGTSNNQIPLQGNESNLDITILAPTPDSNLAPYMLGSTIYFTFKEAIEVVDASKITVQSDTSADFGTATAVTKSSSTPPKVNEANDKQVLITLDGVPTLDSFYRVSMAAGAVGGGRNTALTALIETTRGSTDIQAKAAPTLDPDTKPVLEGINKLSVSFPNNVHLLAAKKVANKDTYEIDVAKNIKVEKITDNGDGREARGLFVGDLTIAVDDTDPKKVNITLPGGSVPYGTWQITFQKGSLLSDGRNGNNMALVTGKMTTGKLSDIYKWTNVKTNGTPVSGNRWSGRTDFTSVVFTDPADNTEKIWVLGGYDGTNRLNDVWSSKDGDTWVNESNKLLNSHAGGSWKKYADLAAAENGNALWSAREGHSSVVFTDPANNTEKIWVMGGSEGTNRLNDVWNSADGITWVKVRANVDVNGDGNPDVTDLWRARKEHSSVVFDSKIWVLGGNIGAGLYSNRNDVWSSSAGITWTESKSDSPIHPSRGHDSVVSSDGTRIWVLGGRAQFQQLGGAALYSIDGAEWTSAEKFHSNSENLPYLSSVLFKNRVWNLGGYISKNKRIKKIFSLPDNAEAGIPWVEEKDAGWSARSSHAAVVFTDPADGEEKIWVLGGTSNGTNRLNDVWKFGMPAGN